MRRRIAERLESNAALAPLTGLSSIWKACARPVRSVPLPDGVHAIGVGGLTLGGSGKTPMVLELARLLSVAGVRCGVVASGYPARVRRTRRVRVTDPVTLVGDEAAWLARALEVFDVPVLVGQDRPRVLADAALLADVIVVDGLLQARPRRLGASLLMLDQDAPWQGYCPPAGDLRAAPPALLEACDLVLLHRLARVAAAIENCARAAGKPVLRWTCRLVGAFCPDGYVPVEELAALRLGLVLNIARPARIRNALAEAGIHPLTERLGADHAMPRPPRRAADVQAWLTTPKCATKLGQRWAGAPVWVLDRRLELPAELGRLVLQRALVSAGAVVESPPCCSEA